MTPPSTTQECAVAEVVAEWFDLHASDLVVYAARRVGAGTARDVVSETFRFALENFASFDTSRGNERAWLFGIATNVLRRHWRAEERRLRNQARSVDADAHVLDPLIEVDERLDARERYGRVVDAIATLDPVDRDLLALVVWENMTSAQAAAVLGLRPGAVRSRLSRARAQLTDMLREGAANE